MEVLAAELKLEISSYLGVRDQLAMRKVCKSWRSYLDMSQVFLSRYVDMDVSKMPQPSENHEPNRDEQRCGTQNGHILPVPENVLEHALRTYVQKNTKVVVIRHMDCSYWLSNGNTFDMVGTVLKEKGADLFQLIFKDCETSEQCGDHIWWWSNLQCIVVVMLHGLISATRKLTLDTFTITNALGGRASTPDLMIFVSMPCCYPIEDRLDAGNMYKKLPIVLPHHEFDCTKPAGQLFRSFMVAVDAQCPPVDAVVRDDIVQLCRFWSHCEASHHQWLVLHEFIKSLNEVSLPRSFVISEDVAVDSSIVTALRQLDPQMLNNLTMEALHRFYCLPPNGVVYPRPPESRLPE